MKLIDICVNLRNSQLRDDRSEVLARAERCGVGQMLLTATSLGCVAELILWCETGKRYCTAGVHPHDAGELPQGWLHELASWAGRDEVRAIGETGLDFNRNFTPRKAQLAAFDAQIEVAQAHALPLFVHDRDSEGQVLARLQAAQRRQALPPVVIHCFTGTASDLRAYLGEGFFIGITGWISDVRRGELLRELVREIPLQRLLIETDAPFLRPHNVPADWASDHALPQRLRRRNEPALLPYVLRTIAEHRPEPIEDIAAASAANARRLFGFAL